MTIIFDRVVIRHGTGRRETYSVEAFLELPLDTRIKCILSRDIEFFQGDTKVGRADTLRSLRPSGPSRGD